MPPCRRLPCRGWSPRKERSWRRRRSPIPSWTPGLSSTIGLGPGWWAHGRWKTRRPPSVRRQPLLLCGKTGEWLRGRRNPKGGRVVRSALRCHLFYRLQLLVGKYPSSQVKSQDSWRDHRRPPPRPIRILNLTPCPPLPSPPLPPGEGGRRRRLCGTGSSFADSRDVAPTRPHPGLTPGATQFRPPGSGMPGSGEPGGRHSVAPGVNPGRGSHDPLAADHVTDLDAGVGRGQSPHPLSPSPISLPSPAGRGGTQAERLGDTTHSLGAGADRGDGGRRAEDLRGGGQGEKPQRGAGIKPGVSTPGQRSDSIPSPEGATAGQRGSNPAGAAPPGHEVPGLGTAPGEPGLKPHSWGAVASPATSSPGGIGSRELPEDPLPLAPSPVRPPALHPERERGNAVVAGGDEPTASGKAVFAEPVPPRQDGGVGAWDRGRLARPEPSRQLQHRSAPPLPPTQALSLPSLPPLARRAERGQGRESQAPRVSIGTLEVVITVPEPTVPQEAPAAPPPSAGESFASRFYLRSL